MSLYNAHVRLYFPSNASGKQNNGELQHGHLYMPSQSRGVSQRLAKKEICIFKQKKKQHEVPWKKIPRLAFLLFCMAHTVVHWSPKVFLN